MYVVLVYEDICHCIPDVNSVLGSVFCNKKYYFYVF